jgi:hypothetical protein
MNSQIDVGPREQYLVASNGSAGAVVRAPPRRGGRAPDESRRSRRVGRVYLAQELEPVWPSGKG